MDVFSQRLLFKLIKTCPHPVLVLDSSMEILLMNKGAIMFLEIKEPFPKKPLYEYLPDVSVETLRWTMDQMEKEASLSKECVVNVDVTGMRHRLVLLTIGISGTVDERPKKAFLLMFQTNPSEALDPHNIKMATIGEFSAGIAHELNTPLANISLIAENLMDDVKDENITKELNKILAQVEVSARIVKELLAFSRKGRPTFEMVDLNMIINEVLESMQVVDRYNIILELDEALPLVKADPFQVQEVMINLMMNARDSMTEGGDMIIRTRFSERWIEVDVEDSGNGIPEEILEEIFNPFFTTKPHGQGVGLGLAICQRIMISHKGEIKVNSEPGKGSVFTIQLPRGG